MHEARDEAAVAVGRKVADKSRSLKLVVASCLAALLGVALFILISTDKAPISDSARPSVDAQEQPRRIDRSLPDPDQGRVPIPQQSTATPSRSTAVVCLLERATLEPPVGTIWDFSQEDSPHPPSKTVTVTEDGIIALASGNWSARCLDGDFMTVEPQIHLSANENHIVWVTKKNRLVSVRVVDSTTEPICGAQIYWSESSPWDTADQWWTVQWNALSKSDAEGFVSLPSDIPLDGTLSVQALGYSSRSFILQEVATEVRPTVVMGRNPNPWTIIVQSGETGEPLGGARFISSDGPLMVDYTGNGKYRLDWLDGSRTNARVSVEADNYCPCHVVLSGSPEESVMLVLATQVAVKTDSSRAAILWPQLDSERQRGACAFVPEYVRVLPSKMALLSVPRQADVTIFGVDETGKQGTTRFTAVGPQQDVAVLFLRVDSLNLTLHSDGSNDVAQGEAAVRYGDGGIILLSAEKARIEIPGAERVTEIRVSAPGYETTRLVREGAEFSRNLDVQLRQSNDVELAIMNRNGRPVVGIEVVLVGAEGSRNLQLFPELHGQTPSGNAGWAMQSSPLLRYVTDGRGRAHASLGAGHYRAQIDVPVAARRRLGLSGYSAATQEFTVTTGGLEVVLSAEKALRYVLDVHDATSQVPVSTIAIQVESGGVVESEKASFELWVAEGTHEIFVSSPGYALQSVILDKKKRIDVALSRAKEVTLFCRNSSGGLPKDGLRAIISAFSLSATSNEDCLWRSNISIPETGEVSISIPVAPPVRMTLDTEDKKARLIGLQAVWDGQSRLEFEVTPREN